MKKNSKILKGFLVAGITALTMPPIVYGQTAVGESSSGTYSGSSGTSGMTGSTGTHSDSSSMSALKKDMATTDADKRLNRQMRQALNSDTSLANVGQNIHFDTQNGEVTLHGSVASETEKNQIEQKVKQLSDVKSVQNEIEVSSVGSSSLMGSPSDKDEHQMN